MKRYLVLLAGVAIGSVFLLRRVEPSAGPVEDMGPIRPESIIRLEPVRPPAPPLVEAEGQLPKGDPSITLADLVTDGLDHAGLVGEVTAVDCSAQPCLAFARVALGGSPLADGAVFVERMAHAWDGELGLTWRPTAVVEPSDPGRPYALWVMEFGAADAGSSDDAREEEYSEAEETYLDEAGRPVAVGVW